MHGAGPSHVQSPNAFDTQLPVRSRCWQQAGIACLRFTLCCATGSLYPSIAAPILEAMVSTLDDLHQGCNVTRSFGAVGAPWEFNLRDLLRWCQLATSLAKSRWVARRLGCIFTPAMACRAACTVVAM